MARGKVITTHLRTGDPNGIRTVFISNKICEMIVFPKSGFDAQRTGIHRMHRGTLLCTRRVILPPCQEQTAGAEYIRRYYPMAINLLSGKSYLKECAKEVVLPSLTAVMSMPRRWNSSMSA